jgi:cytochrome c oxidase subunit 2
MTQGEEVYNSRCAACHKPDGLGMPPAFPALKGSAIANGPVQDHLHIVLNGKPGTAMVSFAKQLTDDEIAAVVTYERNAWGNGDQQKYGNNAGGLVQAADVAAARNK